MALRIPPLKRVKDPEGRHLPGSLKESYLTEVRNFFKEYKPSEKDNMSIIDKVILDPSVYESMKLLREAVVTKNDLEKLKKKGVDDVDRVLKVLWENKMLSVFQDLQGSEYYTLLSDFYVSRYYPHFNIDNILRAYRDKTKNPDSLLKALDIMKDEFYAVKEAQKHGKDKDTQIEVN